MIGLENAFDPGLQLMAAMPSLSPVYLICLIIGGGLLVVSTVFGGDHDADIGGADVELDGGLDLDAHTDIGGDMPSEMTADHAGDVTATHGHDAPGALSLSSWFSIRFLVYAAAVFGAVGTVLTYMTTTPAGWVLLIALLSGLVVGQGVHQTIRALQRSSGDGGARLEDFVDRPARVTIPIVPPARGEVEVQVRNSQFYVAAKARRTDDRFNVGDEVTIASYTNGTAEVISRQEHEFMKQ